MHLCRTNFKLTTCPVYVVDKYLIKFEELVNSFHSYQQGKVVIGLVV